MTRNAQDIIDDMRNIVKPRIAKMLLETNFEGCGKEDKAEFETEFEMILTLAEKALEQEPILDEISTEIEELDSYVEFDEDLKTSFNMIRLEEVQRVIDKYKAESEVEDGECR